MDPKYDKHNLALILENFPNQFAEALEIAKNCKTSNHIERIIVTAMGGSALPADIVNIYICRKPCIEINRDYQVPAEVNHKTLVIAISYSGNTEETVMSLLDAMSQGAHLAIITAGGELKKIGQKHKIPMVLLPSGLQPRCATGYIFSAIISILQNSKIIKERKREILEMADELRTFSYKPLAKDLAQEVKKRVPVIYTSERFMNIARIWKIKINENAKTQSFFNSFPEFNHNEMVGFTKLIMKPFLIVITNQEDHALVKKRIRITQSILKEKGIPTYEVKMKGSTLLTQIFYTLLLGDWFSYYLALQNKVDPTPVKMVESFKNMMKQ